MQNCKLNETNMLLLVGFTYWLILLFWPFLRKAEIQ